MKGLGSITCGQESVPSRIWQYEKGLESCPKLPLFKVSHSFTLSPLIFVEFPKPCGPCLVGGEVGSRVWADLCFQGTRSPLYRNQTNTHINFRRRSNARDILASEPETCLLFTCKAGLGSELETSVFLSIFIEFYILCM